MRRAWRWVVGVLAALLAAAAALVGVRKYREDKARSEDLARTAAALALENARRAREHSEAVRVEAERKARESVAAVDNKAAEAAGSLDDLAEYFRRLGNRSDGN